MKENNFLLRKAQKTMIQKSSGYALGRRIRTRTSQQFYWLGKTLNTGQQHLGNRTTGILLALLWGIAFCYFTNLLLSFIDNL